MREVDYKKYRGHITDVLNLRIWNMDNGRKVSEYLDLLRSQKGNICLFTCIAYLLTYCCKYF